MKQKITMLVSALMLASPVVADSLKNIDRMLCVPGPVSSCVVGEGCSYMLPEGENIPDFIEVDLKHDTLAATRASGEDRTTPIQHKSRQAGYIYLQGVENGRSYSLVISENSGDLTFVVAADGVAATMFGACTPD